MSKKLVVHIGAPKTGSTTLQRTLLNNKGFLCCSGVSYIGTPDPEFSYFFRKELRSWPKDYRKSFLKYSDYIDSSAYSQGVGERPGDFNSTPEEWRKKWSIRINTEPNETVVISRECLVGTYDFPYKKVEERAPYKLKYMLEGFDDVTLVLFVRNQATWLESWYQTLVSTHCFDQKFSSFLDHPWVKTCDWYEKAEEFKKALPDAKLIVKTFEHAVREGGVTQSFLQLLNLIPEKAIYDTTIENESLDKDYIPLFLAWGKIFPVWKMQALRRILLNYKFSSKSFFSIEKARQIMDFYRSSNMRLFEEYGLGGRQDFLKWECLFGDFDRRFSNPVTEEDNDNSIAKLADVIERLAKESRE